MTLPKKRERGRAHDLLLSCLCFCFFLALALLFSLFLFPSCSLSSSFTRMGWYPLHVLQSIKSPYRGNPKPGPLGQDIYSIEFIYHFPDGQIFINKNFWTRARKTNHEKFWLHSRRKINEIPYQNIRTPDPVNEVNPINNKLFKTVK